ncbi:FMN-binding split barrel [Trema orientale]|uniref:FMN-binding split barrel n=1 Tax=Trema orientale TaxID=63057 RepID=A0A2P5DCL0_TREOI|nr:FMN-binding split barrel [Trema orientale]
MLLQTQSLSSHSALSLFSSIPVSKFNLNIPKPNPPFGKIRFRTVKCSISTVSELTHLELKSNKPFPAEVSRTIMELGSVGTLSTLTREGWPLGIGVRFAVDPEGTPVLCLNSSDTHLSIDSRSSLHVQLEQCGLWTPQCTILGNINKPEDGKTMKNKMKDLDFS